MKGLLYFIIGIVLINGCSSDDSKSTRLDSDHYESLAERIEVLNDEIKASSPCQDAEFELFNVNGFKNQRTSIPGASSWDYKFVVRVDTSDVSSWIGGMEPIECIECDDKWAVEIIKGRKQNWNTDSEPRYFADSKNGVMMKVYRKEGIIYKRVLNQN